MTMHETVTMAQSVAIAVATNSVPYLVDSVNTETRLVCNHAAHRQIETVAMILGETIQVATQLVFEWAYKLIVEKGFEIDSDLKPVNTGYIHRAGAIQPKPKAEDFAKKTSLACSKKTRRRNTEIKHWIRVETKQEATNRTISWIYRQVIEKGIPLGVEVIV